MTETLEQALEGPWLPALTLTPPWSWLVWRRWKRNETRGWHRPDLVGRWLAIHSAVSLEPVGGRRGLAALCAQEPFRSALGGSEIGQLPVGAVVALARIWAMHPTAQGWDAQGRPCAAYVQTTGAGLEHFERVVPVLGDEAAFGDYSPGRWVWEFDEILPLAEPIAVRGHQKIWHWWLGAADLAQLRKVAKERQEELQARHEHDLHSVDEWERQEGFPGDRG
ncbi:MAG TPA: hypothetical protein VFS21_01780 [Roseiflexaceae bacterium]|nr:hypothetical protein [Roseiflexaceae bacterium]